MPKTWFHFTNNSDTEAEVTIYDAIGLWGVSAKAFIDELKKHTGKLVTVRINSPGGVVTEGYAIFNALKRHKGGVIVQIDGLCASMATYVALAGTPVRMAENSFFMIHNVSGSAWGTPEEMRRAADVAEKLQKNIVAAYVAKTGKTSEEIEEKMDEETWFTAEEAKDFGFIDEITDPIEVAASLSDESRAWLGHFRNPPTGLVDSTATPTPEKRPSPKMKLLTAALASALATASGLTVTDASTEAEVKAALDALSGKLTALEGEKKTLGDKVTALEGEKKSLGDKVTMLEGEKKQLGDQVTALEGSKQTVDQKAQEIAAAHNSNATAGKGKEEAESAKNQQPDGKAHYDAYQAAMAAGENRKATEIWNTHVKAITAYVATIK